MNRLARETSPYLLQHQHNPVDWYPWGEEALAKARAENKPIFLSIGYAACHWCHVMERESFEDPEIAELMNARFVNIKVDREERPDLDSIYMGAVVAMTGQGGWPMSVFLTPEGLPFFGGTYFPPVPRYGMPSFRDVLAGISRAWQEDPSDVGRQAQRLSDELKARAHPPLESRQVDHSTLERASQTLAQSYDWQNGGWGQPPKFPQPMATDFLLQRAAHGDNLALSIATHALDSMARGGMFDLVGGGFSRYSVDANWRIPHFEKMLYDNAQLATAYLHAYLLTRQERYLTVTQRTLDFILAELTDPAGGFYSSLDADSEGEEGKFYQWDMEHLRKASQAEDWELIVRAFGLDGPPNFEGRWILQRTLADADLAEVFSTEPAEVKARLDGFLSGLHTLRAQRVRPATDDKVLLSWNGLALRSLAEAAWYLRSDVYLEAAQRCAAFLTSHLVSDGQAFRSWRQGKAIQAAFLEDYAALGLGLLALYQADMDTKWYAISTQLASQMLTRFRAKDVGFFDSDENHGGLLYRPADLQDNATPCGNSLAAEFLLRLAALGGDGELYETADQMIRRMSGHMAQYPLAFGNWLRSADLFVNPIKEVAIILPSIPAEGEDLLNAIRQNWIPNLALAAGGYPVSDTSPELLKNRPPVNGQPTAYVCRQMVCQPPAIHRADLLAQLEVDNLDGIKGHS